MNVWLDQTDLTEFSFPRISDPSDWHEAIGLVKKLQDGVDDLEDPAEIKQHELFDKKQGVQPALDSGTLGHGTGNSLARGSIREPRP